MGYKCPQLGYPNYNLTCNFTSKSHHGPLSIVLSHLLSLEQAAYHMSFQKGDRMLHPSQAPKSVLLPPFCCDYHYAVIPLLFFCFLVFLLNFGHLSLGLFLVPSFTRVFSDIVVVMILVMLASTAFGCKTAGSCID